MQKIASIPVPPHPQRQICPFHKLSPWLTALNVAERSVKMT